MQTKCSDGSVMVCGGCAKDAVLEYVGDDNKRICKVGLAVGKRPGAEGGDPVTVWCNVVAWHGLAAVLSQARKGDQVLAVGRLKSRTYNDKEYTDLVADFVSVCPLSSAPAQPRPAPAAPPADGGFGDLADDDGELPF